MVVQVYSGKLLWVTSGHQLQNKDTQLFCRFENICKHTQVHNRTLLIYSFGGKSHPSLFSLCRCCTLMRLSITAVYKQSRRCCLALNLLSCRINSTQSLVMSRMTLLQMWEPWKSKWGRDEYRAEEPRVYNLIYQISQKIHNFTQLATTIGTICDKWTSIKVKMKI